MASAGPGMASSHPYTCNTCLVAFKNSELQRGHMQSDWHRYNLKRRVASLPPLSSEIFTEKVLANQATAAATAARASFERLCAACEKTYFSENAYQNHLGSQKHRLRLAQLANGSVVPTEDETNSVVSSVFSLGDSVDTRPAAVEDEVAEAEFSQVVDGIKKASLKDGSSPGRPSRPPPSAADDRPVHPLSPSDDDHDSTEDGNTELDDTKAIVHCLFCNATSENLESNMKHMRGTHGLFIPEQEYLIDQEGLVKWLSSRVRFLHECLYCGMIRHTTTGIQTHMRDKGHCMIAFDAEEQMVEVGQFYDFRSTYSDESMEDDLNDNDAKRRTGKLGARRKAPAENDENEDEDMAEGDGEGWETDDSEPVASGETGNDTRPTKRRRPLRPTDTQQIYYDDEGLHLPSGRLAGHRSLARYYRQNLQNYPTPEERASRQAITDTPMEDGDSTVAPVRRGHDQKAVTRANGGLGMLGVSDAKKREVQAIEKRDRKRAQQQQSRYQAGNEKRHNSQKHFRDPLLQ